MKQRFLALALLLASLIALAASRNSTPTGNTITVSDELGSPIANAWVVVSAEEDLDADGVISSASGFTDASGKVVLNLPQEGDIALINAVAPGHTATVHRYIGSSHASSSWSPTLTLTAAPSAMYWGQLSGGGQVSGIQVQIEESYALPRAVSDGSGRFALSLDRSFPLNIQFNSPLITFTSANIDPTDLGSHASPNLFAVEPLPSEIVHVQVSPEFGASSTSPELRVYYTSTDEPGYETLEWMHAEPRGSAGAYQFTGYAGAKYIVLAVDGTRWATASFSAGSVSAINLELPDAGSAAITVSVLDASGSGMPVNGGRVSWRLCAQSLPGSKASPVLGTIPTDSNGDALVADLLPGAYRLVYHDSIGQHAVRDGVVVTTGQSLTVPMDVDFWTVHRDASSTGPLPSKCQISGSIIGPIGPLGSIRIALERPGAGITESIELQSAGTFVLDGIDPGPVRLVAIGVDQADEQYLQAGGPLEIFLDDPVVDVGVITLDSTPVIQALAFEADGAWQATGKAAGVLIEVRRESDGALIAQATTAQEGVVSFGGLPRVPVSVSASRGSDETSLHYAVDLSAASVVIRQFLVR